MRRWWCDLSLAECRIAILHYSTNKKLFSNSQTETKIAFIYFLLTNAIEEQMNFVSELFIRASCSCLRLFAHHVVRDVELDGQEKRIVLTTCSWFKELCRVSIMQYMERFDKKLAGTGPEVSVHPGITLFFLFCMLYRILLCRNKQIFLHHVIN